MKEKAGKQEEWSLIVRSTSGWFDVHLKDLWKYRDLIIMFVRRDFIASYKQTILGPMWFLIQPLLTTIMFIVVFGGIAKLPTDGIPSALFYLSGLTIWNYFASCFTKTSGTFIANTNIFGKVYFPRLSVPVSTVISTLLNFAVQFALFISFLIYYVVFKNMPFKINAYVLLLPLLLLIMGGIGLGFGIIVSSLTIKYRDLSYIVPFGTQLLMYATPVIFPLSMIQGKKRLLILANPMTSIIEAFRYTFFPHGEFKWMHLGYSFVFMIIVLFIGVILFNKTEKNFVDTV